MWTSIVKKKNKNMPSVIKNENINKSKINFASDENTSNIMSSEEIFEMKYNLLIFDNLYSVVEDLKYKTDLLDNICSNEIMSFMDNFINKNIYNNDSDDDYDSDE